MRMPERIGRAQRVDPRLERGIDVAEAEMREAQQGLRVDLGVLPVQVGGRGVPLGDVQLQRSFELRLRRRGLAVGHERLAQHAMSDDLLGFESALLGPRQERLRERDRFAGAAAAIDEGELSEREREDPVRRRAFVAQLEAALAAGGQVGRRRAQRRE